MSAETRKAINDTDYYLKQAGQSIEQAAEHANKSGDKSLVQKVTKTAETVKEIRQEIKKKTDSQQS